MTFKIAFSVHFHTLWKIFSVHFCTQWHVVNFLWSSNIGCILYHGSQLTDSWKRTKLNGKFSDLPDRISSVFNVPLSNINVDGYICNWRSYRDLKSLEKILEDAKSLQQQSLKEKFTTNNRTKRCVPSNSKISPSVSGLSKSLHHVMDKFWCDNFCTWIFARQKSAGSNMIGLNQQKKLHASSRSFGGWVWAHFPKQWLVIEPMVTRENSS